MKADAHEKATVVGMVDYMLGRKPPIPNKVEEEQAKIICPISLIPPSQRKFLCDIPKTRDVFLKTSCTECSEGGMCIPRETHRDLADEEVNTRPLYPKPKVTHSRG